MKKTVSLIAAWALMLGAFTQAYSADEVKVELDGAGLEFDVAPQIIEGRTLVPLRVIFEALGAEVDWNGETRTVTADKGDIEISMTIGDNIMRINSKEVTLDVPPQIIDDRTLVPARAVAEGFGAKVDWNGDTRTVIIASNNTVVEPTSESTAAPTEKPSKFPIEYNDEPEFKAYSVSNFELVSVSRNSEGNYDIEYEVKTFFEGRGTVTATFRCLDENGKEVDRWSRVYSGTDYTWTLHEDKVTVSGKTAVIELLPEQ